MPFTPPRQQRSEETLRRIAAVARELLTRKRFDEITLGELTEGAGVTVGAFYTRFRSKDALFEYLERDMRAAFPPPPREAEGPVASTPAEQHLRHLKDEDYDPLRQATASPSSHTTADVLRMFVQGITRSYQENKGVMREIAMRARSEAGRQVAGVDMTQEAISMAVGWLLQLQGTIGHPDPPRGARIALMMATSALRDVILFDENWQSPTDEPLPIETLQEEIIEAVAAYLHIS